MKRRRTCGRCGVAMVPGLPCPVSGFTPEDCGKKIRKGLTARVRCEILFSVGRKRADEVCGVHPRASRVRSTLEESRLKSGEYVEGVSGSGRTRKGLSEAHDERRRASRGRRVAPAVNLAQSRKFGETRWPKGAGFFYVRVQETEPGSSTRIRNQKVNRVRETKPGFMNLNRVRKS